MPRIDEMFVCIGRIVAFPIFVSACMSSTNLVPLPVVEEIELYSRSDRCFIGYLSLKPRLDKYRREFVANENFFVVPATGALFAPALLLLPAVGVPFLHNHYEKRAKRAIDEWKKEDCSEEKEPERWRPTSSN